MVSFLAVPSQVTKSEELARLVSQLVTANKLSKRLHECRAQWLHERQTPYVGANGIRSN